MKHFLITFWKKVSLCDLILWNLVQIVKHCMVQSCYQCKNHSVQYVFYTAKQKKYQICLTCLAFVYLYFVLHPISPAKVNEASLHCLSGWVIYWHQCSCSYQKLKLRQNQYNYNSNTCGRKKQLSHAQEAPQLNWLHKLRSLLQLAMPSNIINQLQKRENMYVYLYVRTYVCMYVLGV